MWPGAGRCANSSSRRVIEGASSALCGRHYPHRLGELLGAGVLEEEAGRALWGARTRIAFPKVADLQRPGVSAPHRLDSLMF